MSSPVEEHVRASMISVVVPTYRRSESLKRLLTALLAQRSVNIEVIIVDQNPSGWLRSLLDPATLGAIRVLRLEQPNVSAARNRGFEASTGEIVVFLDDDLIPEPDFCARGMAVLALNPGVGCLCPLIHSDAGRDDAIASLRHIAIGGETDTGPLLRIRESISASIFFRREYFERSGGFDPFLFEFARAAEDQEFFLRLARRGMETWLYRDLAIFHDERTPGGCEMRTAEYWQTRRKCVRSWALRHRIHGEADGKLRLHAYWSLLRSAVLNRDAIMAGPAFMWKHIKLLREAVADSAVAFRTHAESYRTVASINHLACPLESQDSCGRRTNANENE